jgi:hypothetical protein
MNLPAEVDEDFKGLPCEADLRAGLEDFEAGRVTIWALLAQIGAPRLRDLGVPLPENIDIDADRKLYFLLAKEFGNDAHARYNSFLRELISFERALERRVSARRYGVE